MQIEHTIEINSTPETVFSWLAKPEKAMIWMKSVSKTEMLNETPDMVGTTFREFVEEGGKGIVIHGLVTGYEPCKLISFHLSSKIHTLDVEYSLEKRGDFVQLRVDSTIHWKFPMNVMSLFIGSRMEAGIIAQLKDEFEKLKELCEMGNSNQLIVDNEFPLK